MTESSPVEPIVWPRLSGVTTVISTMIILTVTVMMVYAAWTGSPFDYLENPTKAVIHVADRDLDMVDAWLHEGRLARHMMTLTGTSREKVLRDTIQAYDRLEEYLLSYYWPDPTSQTNLPADMDDYYRDWIPALESDGVYLDIAAIAWSRPVNLETRTRCTQNSIFCVMQTAPTTLWPASRPLTFHRINIHRR